jgi:hypothetical protein
MLSPHEFATLMLLKDAPDQIDLDRADLEALLERQLITLEKLTSGQPRPLITINGHSVLKAAARIRWMTPSQHGLPPDPGMMRDSIRVWSNAVPKAWSDSAMERSNGKESSVTDLWTGIIVGSFGLAVATLLVIGHYRRELTRQRLLRQMDHRHCWDVMRNRR